MKKIVKNPFFYGALLVALDQWTKYLVRGSFTLGESREIASFLHLTYLTNTGVAFSFFQGANTVFMFATAALVLGFSAWCFRSWGKLTRRERTAFVLLLAGACGNLIDRVVLGHVTDFLDLSLGTYHWPAFNVADSSVCTGGFLLFISLLAPHPVVRPAKPDTEGK